MKKAISVLILLAVTTLAGQYTITTICDENAYVYEYVLGRRSLVFLDPSTDFMAQGATNFLNNIRTPVTLSSSTFGLSVGGRLGAAGTSAITTVVQKSYDGTNWETGLTFTLTAAGTTYVNTTTNLTVNDYGFVRIFNITNGNAALLTNLTVRFYTK